MADTSYYKITITRTDAKGSVTVDEHYEADDSGSIKEVKVDGRSKTNAVGRSEIVIKKISKEEYSKEMAKAKKP